jgi:hypothetical protein
MLGLRRLIFLGGVVSVASAATPPVVHSQEAPVRDHQLFVGVDLVMNHDEALVDVRKIENKKVSLDNADREVVSLRDSDGLQWRLATKVSATSANISAFKPKRVMSPAKNPALKQLRDKQALMAFADDQKERREVALRQSMRPSQADPSTDTPALTEEEAAAEMSAAVAEIDKFSAMGAAFDRAKNFHHGDEGFDAVQLSFEISSPTPIADAYVVAIMRVSVDGNLHDTTFYRQLGRVDESPRKVRFLQAGLPSGYEIKDARVHLYWQGEEIPTNMSEKNYAVTSAEAKMYLQTDYLGKHRFDSAPASPAWSMVPPALLAAEGPSEYDLPVTVELDAEGQLLAIQSENVIVPAGIRTVVEQMTFVPAVEKGKGVPSTLTINPADFFKIN